MSWQESFNRSGLSRFLNSPSGRVFRVAAGIVWLVVGFRYRKHPSGVLAMLWSIFPLSAGAFDVCFISVALGGPFSGEQIRSRYHSTDC